MGDKRGHRDRDRHRAEEPFEQTFPVVRHPPRTLAAPRENPAVEGTVKWFNTEKGFGFVSLGAGGEAFIHVSRIKPLGYDELSEGSPITVRLGPGKKGSEVVEVIEVGSSPPRPIERAPRTALPITEEVEVIGVVKWFNAGKGFGFVAAGERQKDVFVSARTLERAGLSDLHEGQRVRMKVIVKPKGPEALSIAVVE